MAAGPQRSAGGEEQQQQQRQKEKKHPSDDSSSVMKLPAQPRQPALPQPPGFLPKVMQKLRKLTCGRRKVAVPTVGDERFVDVDASGSPTDASDAGTTPMACGRQDSYLLTSLRISEMASSTGCAGSPAASPPPKSTCEGGGGAHDDRPLSRRSLERVASALLEASQEAVGILAQGRSAMPSTSSIPSRLYGSVPSAATAAATQHLPAIVSGSGTACLHDSAASGQDFKRGALNTSISTTSTSSVRSTGGTPVCGQPPTPPLMAPPLMTFGSANAAMATYPAATAAAASASAASNAGLQHATSLLGRNTSLVSGLLARTLQDELKQSRQVASSSSSQVRVCPSLLREDSGGLLVTAGGNPAVAGGALHRAAYSSVADKPITRVARQQVGVLPALVLPGGARQQQQLPADVAAAAAAGAALTPRPPSSARAAPDAARRAAAAMAYGHVDWSSMVVQPGQPSRLLHVSATLPASMQRPVWSSDDFRILKRLHKGYASSVFKAVCMRSQAVVALKVYYLCTISDHIKHQIYREVEIHGQLKHRNIVELYCAFQDEKYVIMVQEFCGRGDLFDCVRQARGRLAEAEVRDLVIAPLVDTLRYLHSMCIIHRDIKPENLMISSTGEIKLGDFGVAIDMQYERAVTQTGTTDYMAPEVKMCPLKVFPSDNKDNANVAYTTAVDVWSLGVLAYELMVGFPPFASAKATGQQQSGSGARMGQPLFPRSVSEPAKELITAALAEFGGDRPTAAELLGYTWLKNHKLSQGERSRPHVAELPAEHFF